MMIRLGWPTMETTANVVTVCTCIVVVGFLLERRFGSLTQSPTVHAYQAGDVLPKEVAIDVDRAQRTVLFVLSSECRYCTESMTFYRRLIAEHSNGGDTLQFVVVTTDSVDVMASYLRLHELRVAHVYSVRPGVLRIRGTPTLLLVNRSRVVEASWAGRLPADNEADVLRTLTRLDRGAQ